MSIMGLTFVIYIAIILSIGIVSYFYTHNLEDYMLGGRDLSAPIMALGAGASDMSSWLLLALPGAVMAKGLSELWLVFGLVIGSFANFQLIAKRLRIYTEVARDAITIPAYFENRFHDNGGILRLCTAFVILIFFTFYTASGFVAGGLLFSSSFGVSYITGLMFTAIIIFTYTCVGGFLAIAWIDFFQGILMWLALLALPITAALSFNSAGDFHNALYNGMAHPLDLWQGTTVISIISLLGWGLGYMGQPHILVRFMAIREPAKVPRAQAICLSWMYMSLLGAVATGIAGIAYYAPSGLGDTEKVFITLSQALFNPWVAGWLLAAVLSALMSTASAQLLASSSAVVEDGYHKFLRPKAGSKELLIISRLVVVGITIVAVLLALDPQSSILNLVSYAWAGLGASFGPVVLLSLLWQRMTLSGAFTGIISGAVTVIVWNLLQGVAPIFNMYEIIPGFIAGVMGIVLASLCSQSPAQAIHEEFNTYRTRLNAE